MQFELKRYLEDAWEPVIERDIDGAAARCRCASTRRTPNFGRYSACRPRRPHDLHRLGARRCKTANRGIDDRRISSAACSPARPCATFGDALRRLTDQATPPLRRRRPLLVLDPAERLEGGRKSAPSSSGKMTCLRSSANAWRRRRIDPSAES